MIHGINRTASIISRENVECLVIEGDDCKRIVPEEIMRQFDTRLEHMRWEGSEGREGDGDGGRGREEGSGRGEGGGRWDEGTAERRRKKWRIMGDGDGGSDGKVGGGGRQVETWRRKST